MMGDLAKLLEGFDFSFGGRAEARRGVEDGEGEEEELTPAQVYRQAAGLLAVGMALVTAFADPMVGASAPPARAHWWSPRMRPHASCTSAVRRMWRR